MGAPLLALAKSIYYFKKKNAFLVYAIWFHENAYNK